MHTSRYPAAASITIRNLDPALPRFGQQRPGMTMREPRRFVAYLRISNDSRGRSGLGLEAQRQAVAAYVAQAVAAYVAPAGGLPSPFQLSPTKIAS
jgi:hypothetical protein